MILGSKASSYAILSVIEVARHQASGNGGGSIRAAEIARQFHLPAAYAAKVMTQLVRANVLDSVRGPRGGFRLTRAPDQIPVLEIVEAVDGLFELEPALNSSAEARSTLLGVNAVFAEVVAEVRTILGRRTVADFIGGGDRGGRATGAFASV